MRYRELGGSGLTVSVLGLGKADAIESVEVTWPTGVTERFTGVKPDAVAVLKEGAGAR